MTNVLTHSVIESKTSGAASNLQVRSSVPADSGQSRLVPLSQGKFATVDPEDYEWLSQWKWSLRKAPYTSYAVRGTKINGKWTTIIMHRLIMNAQKGQEIDHINHNGLDNRKCNLRFCTRSQNIMNTRPKRGTSKYKGVSWCKMTQNWLSCIMMDGEYINLGYYDDEIDAAKTYDDKAKELFGEFACLNFPQGVEQ